MKKIVIDARGLQYSTGRYARKLLDYLQIVDTKNQYLVVLNPDDAFHWRPSADNYSIVISHYLHGSFGEQFGYAWQLYRLNADLVHFTMPQQPVCYLKNKITTIHDLTLTRFKSKKRRNFVAFLKKNIFSILLKGIAGSSAAIITPSKLVKEELLQFKKKISEKVHVIYESADEIEQPEQPLNNLLNQKFILYVGNVFPHKNAERLVDAFSKFKEKSFGRKLVFAGKHDFYYQQLKKYVDKNSIRDVVFTGYISDLQLKFLYKNADCLVIPSLSEGFGLPGLEAMCYGLPVIASNTSCLPEIYSDAALYFNPLDVNDIAHKIEEVVTNNQIRATLGQKGTQQIAKYSWKKTANETAEIYQNCLGA